MHGPYGEENSKIMVFRSIPLCLFIVILAAGVSLRSQWIENGIPVCNYHSNRYDPQIVTDGAGGAIIVWEDRRSGYSIYAQRIGYDSSALWAVNGVNICDVEGSKYNPHVTSDGLGGAIIAWRDFRSGSGRIYAQKIDANGNFQWRPEGVDCLADGVPTVASDGQGGAYLLLTVPWDRNSDIYVQRISANGNLLWEETGKAICAEENDQAYGRIVSYGVGGAVIVWRDSRNGSYDIYAQKIVADGTVLWETDGVAICTGEEFQSYPQITTDNAGGAIVTWFQSYGEGSTYRANIYIQHIDAGGNRQWGQSGVPVSNVQFSELFPSQLVSDGSGGAIVTWAGIRGDGYDMDYVDVYAQKVNAKGVIQWAPEGVAICTADDMQFKQQIVADGTGGAIIAWQDYRRDSDIYIQAVAPDGTVKWRTDGILLCGAANDQLTPQLVSDGRGGAIATWKDNRWGRDIYAMKVSEFGSVVTILETYAARLDGYEIVIEWSLVEITANAGFYISRAEGDFEVFEQLQDHPIFQEDLSFTFRDQSCEPGKNYRYRVDASDDTGQRLLFETDSIDVPEIPPVLPLTLYQNYPNPFNPATRIKYHLPVGCNVVIEVYGITGGKMTTLVDTHKSAGDHWVDWNGKDYQGNDVSSGVYLYRMTAGEKTLSRKIVLLK